MARREDVQRIGLLLPSSNTVQEGEFCSALPKGMALHVTRLGLRTIEADSTLRIVTELEVESRKLADADVDVIVLAATAPSARKGLGYDRELVQRIAAASGKPASTALLAALRALGTRRIVIGAPWGEEVNRTTAHFMEANGLEVLAHHALGHVHNLDVGLLDEETAYETGRRIDRSDAEAVMLACGNWSTFGILERLERDLGKPVLSTNQVSLWHVLAMLGSGPLPGLGRLLREHLPARTETERRVAAG